MLYTCAASFPRASIDDCLHDHWDGELLTLICNSSGSVRNCRHHFNCSREPLSKRCSLCPKAVSELRGVLSEAPHVPVKWCKNPITPKIPFVGDRAGGFWCNRLSSTIDSLHCFLHD